VATVKHLGLFPFCVSPYPPNSHIDRAIQEAGPFTEYPFKLPVRFCTRMWWTVKHWRISFEYSRLRDLSFLGNPGDFAQETAVVSVETNAESAFADYVTRIENANGNERDLICITSGSGYEEVVRYFNWEIDVDLESRFLEENFQETLQRGVFFATNWDNQVGFAAPFAKSDIPEDSNLWTAMSFGFGGGLADSFTHPENVGGGAVVGEGTFSILGAQRTFPVVGQAGGDVVSFTIDNLLIEPIEFWEYDPGDGGGPIYDKDTGKQLRSFP
jgi:hypothetical protein